MSGRPTPTRFHTEPECPLCREFLIPPATWYVDNTAFCVGCANTVEGPILIEVIRTQQRAEMRGSWSIRQGLYYFTPASHVPRHVAAHLALLSMLARNPKDVISGEAV